MKHFLIILLSFIFISCNCEDTSNFKQRKCRRIKDGVIKYINIQRQYSPGDTIEYQEWSIDPYDVYVVLDEQPILKN